LSARVLEEFNNASDTLAKAQKEAEEAAKQKLESFNEMQKMSKRFIKQAKLDCADDPAKLECIGWDTRLPKTACP